MRQWTPYEKTQLLRAGRGDLLESVVDETPVEYLLNQVNFCGFNFYVSPDVLIPRVETEALVDFCVSKIEQLLQQKNHLVIVEVGTGSGAIGLSLWRKLAQKNLRNNCELNLFDVSEAALVVARKNLDLLLSADQSEFLPPIQRMDLLADWPTAKKIDLLIANLPYIPSERIKTLEASVINHEPVLALDGGSDGLVLIKKLLQQAEKLLSPEGVIWLEVDETHTLDQFESFGLAFQYQSLLDCFEKPRFIRAIRVH